MSWLWCIDWTASAPSSFGRRRQVILGFASSLPFLCRSIGLCVPPVTALTLRRKRAPVITTLIAAAALASLWLVWVLFNTPPSQPLLRYYTGENYVSWWLADGSIFHIPLSNLLGILTATLALQIPLVAAGELRTSWPVVAGIGIYIWREAIIRFNTALGSALMAYVLVILPWTWPPNRFLVPLMPASDDLHRSRCKKNRRTGPEGNTWCGRGSSGRLCRVGECLPTLQARPSHTSGWFPLSNGARASDSVVTLRRDVQLDSDGDSPERNRPSRVSAPWCTCIRAAAGFRPFLSRPSALFYQIGSNPLGSVEEFASP